MKNLAPMTLAKVRAKSVIQYAAYVVQWLRCMLAIQKIMYWTPSRSTAR